MRAILRVTSGPHAGQRRRLAEGTPLRIGRGGRADWIFVDDEAMALSHVEIVFDGSTCSVRDFAKQGTEVNGGAPIDGAAFSGGLLRAGKTTFLLRIYPDDLRMCLPPAMPGRDKTPELLAKRAAALESLSAEENLYALVDAARDRRILALVDACDETSQSLLASPQGESLRQVAPYLVHIARGSALFEVLVNEGWGESWGIYLKATRPFAEVRNRLRQSLFVRNEETGENLYFRFYDPRVLRLFWPTCTPRQKSEILGTEISAFLLENDADDILRLTLETP